MMERFNIRVYGILINDEKHVLVSDEFIRGQYYTKFPGGGLEFGEGTRDCLKREFMEELNLEVEVLDHLYTTDFFQESAFRPGDQIISIYYLVKPMQTISARLSDKKFDFDEEQLLRYEEKQEVETFRFIGWENLSAESVTLPIDKVVVELIKEKF
jgi:ADP-ribose pyrophosphatase YjhB (NUDIX family)